MSKKPPFLTLALAGVILCLFLFRLGDRPLRNPDEGRYAEIAKTMHQSGDWMTPRLLGIEYLRKPILFYWLVAASIGLLGLSEWAVRLVPAVFGLLGVFSVYWFSRRWGESAARTAALMLATNLLYFVTSRYLIIDAVFSFFLTGALFLLYEVLAHAKQPRVRAGFLMAAFAALGFSFLAKGPIGVVLAGMPLVLYGALTGRAGRFFKPRREIWLGLVFVVIVLPWFAAILKAEPEFFRIFFLHENFGRATSSSFEHQEPWYYYLVLTPVFLIPWVFLPPLWRSLVSVLKQERGVDRPLLFLAVSIGSFLLFFSLSKAKLHTYLLPTLSFWAILLGRAWDQMADEEPRFWKNCNRAALLAAVCAVVFILIIRYVYEPRYVQRYSIEFARSLEWIGAAALAGAVMALRSSRRRSKTGLFTAWILFAVLCNTAFVHAMEVVNPMYSTKRFAEALKSETSAAHSEIYMYGQPGAFYDFKFYTDYPVKIVGLTGEFELLSYDKEFDGFLISEAEFTARLASGAPLYVLTRLSDYDHLLGLLQKPPRIVFRDNRKILFAVERQESGV